MVRAEPRDLPNMSYSPLRLLYSRHWGRQAGLRHRAFPLGERQISPFCLYAWHILIIQLLYGTCIAQAPKGVCISCVDTQADHREAGLGCTLVAHHGLVLVRPETPGKSSIEKNAPCVDGRWGVLCGAEQFFIGLPLPMEDSLVQQAKAALNRHGGWLSSYLDGTLLCIGPQEAAEAVRQIPGADWLVSTADSGLLYP